MRAEIRGIDFDADPSLLASDPVSFMFLLRVLLGPDSGPGEESFDLTVCSPEWLANECRRSGVVDGRHHLVVNADQYDERVLRAWLEQRISSVEGETWSEVAEKLARFGYWEFEDYRP